MYLWSYITTPLEQDFCPITVILKDMHKMLQTSTGVEVVAISTGGELIICTSKAESVAPGSIQRVP